MKTTSYILVALFVLCFSNYAFSQIEQERFNDELVLRSGSHPALLGLERLYIVIDKPDTDSNIPGLDRQSLRRLVLNEVNTTSINIEPALEPNTLPSLEIPEYHVRIKVINAGQQLSVLYIQCSLVKKVFLTEDLSIAVKTEVWKTEPEFHVVPTERVTAKIREIVANSARAFTSSVKMSNHVRKTNVTIQKSQGSRSSTTNNNQHHARTEPNQPEYKFMASKNGEVFHKPDCQFAQKIAPRNLVGYDSRDAAIAAGKRPCKRCNP